MESNISRKHLLVIVGISLLSSVLTIGIYSYYDNNQRDIRFITKELEAGGKNARLANYRFNERPYRTLHNAMGNGGGYPSPNAEFTKGASVATPAVVHIKGKQERRGRYDFFFGEGNDMSSGSGVIVSPDGYILTNNHVVENTTKLEVVLNDKRSFIVRKIGTDPSTDLALLKIETADLKGKSLPFLDFADSDALLVGEWVLAVGNPFNLTSTVTAGIISAKGRNIDILSGEHSIESFIQTDAAVNPGNSGGALVTPSGKLVGINTAIMTRTGRYEGYSFAIPSNLAQKVMRDLKEFGEIQRGFLGVYVQEITKEIAQELNLPNMEGVYVERVNRDGSAEAAGVKTGDIVTHVNNISIKSRSELQEQIAKFRPGDNLTISYIRNGKSQVAKITLKSGNSVTKTIPVPKGSGGQIKEFNLESVKKYLGGEFRTLSKAEEKRLDEKGVIVTLIRRGSVLESSNMEGNFIITQINNQPIEDVTDLVRLIQESPNRVEFSGFYEEYKDQGQFVYIINI
jgi:serine protease Do